MYLRFGRVLEWENQPRTSLKNDREALEVEKLKFEIKDLKRWWLKLIWVLLSALAAVLAFLIGQSTIKAQDHIQASSGIFEHAVTDLGDSDPAKRLSGVTVLKSFIEPAPPQSWLSRFLSFFSREEMTEWTGARRREAVILLLARVRYESDLGVIYQSLVAIRSSPNLPLQDIADLNKTAKSSFVDGSAQLFGELLLFSQRAPMLSQSKACTTPGLMEEIEQYIQTLSTRGALLSDKAGNPISRFTIWPFLYSTVNERTFERQLRYALRFDASLQTAGLHKVPTAEEINIAERSFLQESLFLQATSITLIDALLKRRNNLPLDLSGTALVSGNLAPIESASDRTSAPDLHPILELAGINFYGSYFGVAVANTSFAGANLSYADLREIQIDDGVSFAGANLASAIVGPDTAQAFVSAQGEISATDTSKAQPPRSRIGTKNPNPPFCN